MFASATDWIVEFMGGVQFRYTCPYFMKMPLRSCHFWRLSRKAGLGGPAQSGQWAMPCCGQPRQWAACAYARAFAL
eukprot:2462799-Lingulodinium_polyedra.AAC.1